MSDGRKKINKPHDRFIRAMFENKRAAKDFIKSACSEELLKRLDLDTLKPENTVFLSKNLNESFTDLLFKVDIDAKPGYLYFHPEHQSKAEKFMPVRLLSYMISIWERDIKNGVEVLPVVIPVIIYTGKRPYNYGTSILDVIPEETRDIAKNALIGSATLYDINRMSDEAIKRHGVASLFELSMKYIFDNNLMNFIQILSEAYLQHLSPEDWLSYTQIIEYNVAVRGESASEFLSSVRQLIHEHQVPDNLGEIMLTTAESLRQEGRLEGRQEGLQKGLQKGLQRGRQEGHQEGIETGLEMTARNLLTRGFDIETTAEISELSIPVIRAIAKKLENEEE